MDHNKKFDPNTTSIEDVYCIIYWAPYENVLLKSYIEYFKTLSLEEKKSIVKGAEDRDIKIREEYGLKRAPHPPQIWLDIIAQEELVSCESSKEHVIPEPEEVEEMSKTYENGWRTEIRIVSISGARRNENGPLVVQNQINDWISKNETENLSIEDFGYFPEGEFSFNFWESINVWFRVKVRIAK